MKQRTGVGHIELLNSRWRDIFAKEQLPIRMYNALVNMSANIRLETVRDICLLRDSDILKNKNCSFKSLAALRSLLNAHGLELNTEYNVMDETHYWGS